MLTVDRNILPGTIPKCTWFGMAGVHLCQVSCFYHKMHDSLNFGHLAAGLKHQSPSPCIHKALVRPKLEYALSVWDPHHAKWRNALEAVQSRAARFFTRRWHNTSSVTAMKHDLGWEALADRRQLSRVIPLLQDPPQPCPRSDTRLLDLEPTTKP